MNRFFLFYLSLFFFISFIISKENIYHTSTRARISILIDWVYSFRKLHFNTIPFIWKQSEYGKWNWVQYRQRWNDCHYMREKFVKIIDIKNCKKSKRQLSWMAISIIFVSLELSYLGMLYLVENWVFILFYSPNHGRYCI